MSSKAVKYLEYLEKSHTITQHKELSIIELSPGRPGVLWSGDQAYYSVEEILAIAHWIYETFGEEEA